MSINDKNLYHDGHEGHQAHKGKKASSVTSAKNSRQLLVLSGEQSQCQSHALAITQNLHYLNLKNLKKANDFLGQEFDAVIFNTFDDFDANALGAISGTIRESGFLILLKPTHWTKKSLFLKRFQNLLVAHPSTVIINADNTPTHLLSIPPKTIIRRTYASPDQQLAVQAIKKVLSGHRRRSLVITADRGRGKSASLGIASAQLLEEGIRNIIVCAPSKKVANVIFETAKRINKVASISFYSPDELQQQKPKADLLLIDEAGAIPLPLLESFVKHYSRIVLATTLHGYEGSGRGFTLKFFKLLDSIAPDWKHCTLNTPIRYRENDPLEHFIFESLLLHAEPAKIDDTKNSELSNCSVQVLDKNILINNEPLLQDIFGLLISAHYQTKPSDLMLMLDDESISIHTLINPQHNVIAVALVIAEGGLDAELSTEIFKGKRRIKGHLVAQALSANAGIDKAPCLLGERISRIAVHPELQGKGFGSYFLRTLCEKSKADYISTSFGASESLIRFWQMTGFIAVYLGIKRDASSGAHSVIMLNGISNKGKKLVTDAQLRFAKNFPQMLSEPFKTLEADVSLALLNSMKINYVGDLTKSEQQELLAFCKHQRGYENSLYVLWTFTCKTLPSKINYLSDIENAILLYKILQKKSWKRVVKSLGLTGKKQALLLLRQSITKLKS